jgi:Cu/Ag efflux protein CusF
LISALFKKPEDITMTPYRACSGLLTVAIALVSVNLSVLKAEDERKLEVKAWISQINPETKQITLRTKEDKKLVVFADGQTKLRLNDREVRLSDLQVGSEVAIVYQEVGRKNMLSALTVVSTSKEAAPAGTAQESPSKGSVGVIRAPKQITVKGTITKVMPANNEFLLTMPDEHEEVLYLDPKDGSVADLQEGADVTVVYQVRNMVVSVSGARAGSRAPATATTPGATVEGFTTLEGTLFRSWPAENFFILKTPEGQHVMFVDNSTRFRLDNKTTTLKELKAGTPISVQFKPTNGQNLVSTIRPAQAAKPTAPVKKTPK